MPLARGCSPDWWDHVLYFHELLHSVYWLHGAQGVKQGAVLFFFWYCKMRACFICLLPAKQALQAIHHYSLSCGVPKMLAATVAL